MTADDVGADAELVRRAMAGEQQAFSHLVTRHKHWLYRFVRRYVGDGGDAYDVVQDAFFAAMSHLDRYDPQRPFEVWLRRIALNKCRDRARYNSVRRVLGIGRPGAGDADTVADLAAGPEAKISADTALRTLETAIRALPTTLKEPLVLTALEGLSQKEAGQLLGLSAKAVEVRVYRAKRLLAERLNRDLIDDLTDRD